jgi:hypothetical protein
MLNTIIMPLFVINYLFKDKLIITKWAKRIRKQIEIKKNDMFK